jgi:hypothetical protein
MNDLNSLCLFDILPYDYNFTISLMLMCWANMAVILHILVFIIILLNYIINIFTIYLLNYTKH